MRIDFFELPFKILFRIPPDLNAPEKDLYYVSKHGQLYYNIVLILRMVYKIVIKTND